MSVKDIADDFTALCKAGKFDEAGEKHWSPAVVSIEATEGDMQKADGLEAVRAKGQWWAENHEIHDFQTEGPFVNGDQFAVIFRLDVTHKPNGQRMKMDEVALYTVEDDKITEERFLY